MTFHSRIASHVLGVLQSTKYPDTALIGLEEGFDSESLRILAGLSSFETPSLLDHYFERSLEELGIPMPDHHRATMALVRHFARMAAGGQMDPYRSFEEINRLTGSGFERDFAGLWDAYTSYIVLWELESDGLQLHHGSGMSKEQFTTKTRAELRAELAGWLNEPGGASH